MTGGKIKIGRIFEERKLVEINLCCLLERREDHTLCNRIAIKYPYRSEHFSRDYSIMISLSSRVSNCFVDGMTDATERELRELSGEIALFYNAIKPDILNAEVSS